MKNFHPTGNCPIRDVLSRLGDKWSMLVLITLNANGTMRFSDIHKTIGNHTIFRHANFIGCLSADKIKMPVRKYFCFNIPVYRNMAEEPSCRSPYHEEYIQTSVSGNSEGLCRSTYSFLSERR